MLVALRCEVVFFVFFFVLFFSFVVVVVVFSSNYILFYSALLPLRLKKCTVYNCVRDNRLLNISSFGPIQS